MEMWSTVLALLAGAVLGGVLAAAAVRSALLPRLAAARAELAAERRLAVEGAARAARDEQRLSHAFAATAQQSLAQASASFLELARASLGEQAVGATGEL